MLYICHLFCSIHDVLMSVALSFKGGAKCICNVKRCNSSDDKEGRCLRSASSILAWGELVVGIVADFLVLGVGAPGGVRLLSLLGLAGVETSG